MSQMVKGWGVVSVLLFQKEDRISPLKAESDSSPDEVRINLWIKSSFSPVTEILNFRFMAVSKWLKCVLKTCLLL